MNHTVCPPYATLTERVLRDAHAAVEHAKAAGRTRLAEDIAAEQEERYKHAHLVGLAQNTGRRTSQGKRHPAWVMAETLRKRADEVWLLTRRFGVPWTNNAAERALRMVKLQMAVSGCWRRVETAGWYCTVRSYLDTARNHGINLIDALCDAFTSNPLDTTSTTLTA